MWVKYLLLCGENVYFNVGKIYTLIWGKYLLLCYCFFLCFKSLWLLSINLLLGKYLPLCGGNVYFYVGEISTFMWGKCLLLCWENIYFYVGKMSTFMWGKYLLCGENIYFSYDLTWLLPKHLSCTLYGL